MGKILHTFDYFHRQNFYFCHATKPEKVIAEIKRLYKHDITDMSFACAGKTIAVKLDDGTLGIFIWIRDKNDLPNFIHEVVHAAAYALCGRGYIFNEDQEAFSYLTAFLTKEFWKTK